MKVTFLSKIAAVAAALVMTAGAASAQKICIDPGHGGSDSGAIGGGQTEKANVLDKGLKLRTWLNADTADGAGGGSWTVIMTRSTDVFIELGARSTYANSNAAARFMSIHNNAHTTTTANGIETYSATSGSANSHDIRTKVYEEAMAMWPLTGRGVKTANFSVLVNTSMPAELHEAAFITNTADRVYLGSATHRDNQAKSQMFGLQRHYGLAKYTPSTSTIVTVDNSAAGFTASANWGTSSNVAGYYGTNYRARATAAVSDAAVWTGNLPSSGTYRVDAWWTAAADRSATAPYIITHAGGDTTASTNQKVNGGAWRSLGSYSFNAGNNTVKLSCWTTAGFYVIADAVRWVK